VSVDASIGAPPHDPVDGADAGSIMTVNTDFYFVDDLLSERAKRLRADVRAFVDTEVLPVINDYWERADFPFELYRKVAGLGIIGGTIEGYGCPGLTPLESGILAAEMARGDGSLNTAIGVHSGLCMGAINTLGSEEQKQRWLPRMATLDLVGCFALTEPDHGSDSVALETSARLDGDHYVLNGHKRWIGNASFADIVLIWARDEADGKVKGFVMEKDADGNHPAGYRPEVITGKIGKRAVWQPDITITEVRVPVENRLEHANSFKDVNIVLAATRGGVAWESLGHALATYESAVEYALQREQFGKPIASFQLVQFKLAQMLSELTSIQLLCVRMAQLQEQGRLTGAHASLAKLQAANKARWIAREARDILGGNGLLLENHVARHLTDMEVVHTYEGTENMQALIVGREITGISAFA
jgi:glutaryl-CoA dehydrogenase